MQYLEDQGMPTRVPELTTNHRRSFFVYLERRYRPSYASQFGINDLDLERSLEQFLTDCSISKIPLTPFLHLLRDGQGFVGGQYILRYVGGPLPSLFASLLLPGRGFLSVAHLRKEEPGVHIFIVWLPAKKLPPGATRWVTSIA